MHFLMTTKAYKGCVVCALHYCVWGEGGGSTIPVTVRFLEMIFERLDPWCSSPPLQEVGDVSQTSHRRCSLMERDDVG